MAVRESALGGLETLSGNDGVLDGDLGERKTVEAIVPDAQAAERARAAAALQSVAPVGALLESESEAPVAGQQTQLDGSRGYSSRPLYYMRMRRSI